MPPTGTAFLANTQGRKHAVTERYNATAKHAYHSFDHAASTDSIKTSPNLTQKTPLHQQ